MAGQRPEGRVIRSPLPPLDRLQLPYTHYSDTDIRHRIIYVEVSRGCPFTCEFCLSSLDIPVRSFPFDGVLGEIDRLIQRGARSFKFVDRTFNLNLRTARTILQFFLDRMELGLFLHFEMVPDRFPEPLREIVARFPPGALQFEVGIQSFNPDVCASISRRQDFDALERNLRFLTGETGVYIHADLIAGLPGEDIESFALGFDRLVELGPHEIQVGILKRLQGTPIVRHDREFKMEYAELPPYEIVSTSTLSFIQLQGLKRFAKIWDLVANSRNFTRTLPVILRAKGSPFASVWALTEHVNARHPQVSGVGISLKSLTAEIFAFLTESAGCETEVVGALLAADYSADGRSDLPQCLHRWRPIRTATTANLVQRGRERQQRQFAELPRPS